MGASASPGFRGRGNDRVGGARSAVERGRSAAVARISIAVWIGLAIGAAGFAVGTTGVFAGQRIEGEDGGESEGEGAAPELVSWSVNGHEVRVSVAVADVPRDDDGEPLDRIDVRVEKSAGGSFEALAETAWSAWEDLRIDDLFELVVEIREPVEGRLRLAQVGPEGTALGASLDLPLDLREVGVRVYEETVGPAPPVLEVVPGFRHPVVLVAEDRFGRFRDDVSGTYRFELEGPGADSLRIGVAEYSEDMTLDLHTFWTLGGAAPAKGASVDAAGATTGGTGEDAAGDTAPASAGSGAGASAATGAGGDHGLVVEIRDGVARIWIEARPGAAGAVLVGMPRFDSSPLSSMRLRIEPGVTRAGGGEALVLERMTKYATHWRFWLRLAEPVADPWRAPGGSLLATAEVLDGEDWLGVEPPFTSIDWVRCDDEGRCWTFTGEKREFDEAAKMRMIFELRDPGGEPKGRFDVAVN